MKKLFQKILVKVFKKAVKKAVNDNNDGELPKVEPTVSEVESDKSSETGVKAKDPMWVIVLKVIAYIIGLILGGVVTTSCAGHLF